MEKEKPARLDYEQIDILDREAKKFTGTKLEHWTDGKGICGSCQWATIIRRASRNTRTIRCGELGKQVPEDITECTAYQNFTQLSLQQMGQIAIVIDPRPDKYKGYL
jgi:hypothetical protein